MKTKQPKEEDKTTDEETVIEPKTRARKKASDIVDDKSSQDEPKTSKDTKKQPKPRAIVKKRPLGIRKALRSKKAAVVKEKVKNVIKSTRGRKPAVKIEPGASQDKDAVPLIPTAEIKKEPVEETSPSSRSSSPKTAGRRVRVGSDMAMMRNLLSDSPSTLVVGPRTSPYSMRSERSNSPSLYEGKNLRSGKPRKVKNNLLSEVVLKEQKKRRRLLSDSKNPEPSDVEQDCKKLKRGRSCSRDGSEVSKCSDNTESDLSLSETLESDSRELNKKLDKSKTDLDVDIENSIQISTIEKVPSLNDSKTEPTLHPDTGTIVNETKKKSSLHRSTSLDSDNNNSDRQKLDALKADVEDKILLKTDKLFQARSNILTSMSKKFNSKEMSKNIRRCRRGRKAAVEGRRPAAAKTAAALATGSATAPATVPATLPETLPATIPATAPETSPATATATALSEHMDDKHETIETLSKDIDDLIKDLDQNIDRDHEPTEPKVSAIPESSPSQSEAKPVAKFYGLTTPLNSVDDNSILAPATPVKESVTALINETTPSKNDDGENFRLHFEDSVEKSEDARSEITYTKCTTVASIDKLMDRLKEFEEFDKRRQRQESESKGDNKPMMVTNDVVLIPKSGAEYKPLKDMQSKRSPERTIEKENVLSCFENNSAISIVKRDHQVRKSVDVDLPNSVTLIKRNSVSARKESTSSNHSRESDAISIFEKSLGKDVTLTEIRKSVDKSGSLAQIDLHQFATLHPTNSNQTVAGCLLDSSQISITPRLSEAKIGNDFQIITKRKSRESMSRKSSESTNDGSVEEKMAVIEKIKSPAHQSTAVSLTPAPVAIKCPEEAPLEPEALPPPEETIKPVPEIVATETPTVCDKPDVKTEETIEAVKLTLPETTPQTEAEEEVAPINKMEIEETIVHEKTEDKLAIVEPVKEVTDKKSTEEVVKTGKKSARNSIESQPGPSNAFNETPESQKRKENVLRTLGLLTHKAAKEAKIEKAKEKERIYSGIMSNKGKAKSSGDYTGTLKTVIKLNRSGGEKKKHRSSLKMTFQKSKYRSGKPVPEVGEAAAEDSTFYTIERREIAAASSADGGQRKTYSNRLNHDAEAVPEPTEPKETLNLVIPEKASSFSIHPGRLCMDQCFYCGGKFGLFDTPCHIAQIKSSERQKKVLDNEEKLTIDSCLCDACYRHVDRRANCPSYRKRPLKQSDAQPLATSPPAVQTEKTTSPPLEEESGSESGGGGATCHTEGCTTPADYCIRRKWLIKMRSSVNKVLKLKGDYPGLHTIPLCAAHYRCVSVLMACLLCRRRLTKHHNLHFIHHGYTELNPLLAAARVPVQFTERPVLCKGCRYYCSLLQRPGHNDAYAHAYRRKLLQIYNIEVPEQDGEFGEINLDESTKQKKKQRNKSKQRKSTEPDNSSENSSEKTNESTPEKREDEKPIEEDIESLISSNKILVPGAVKSNEGSTPSDGSDENSEDLPNIFNKQTELQYLLQKQNNPAQFLGQPNLTQKQRNILKLHSMSGIQKPGQQHRICEKNAKKIHKFGQIMMKDKLVRNEIEVTEDKSKDGMPALKNISLNDECTIESIPAKRPPDINTLKNKWQMSESFTQVKKNLSELSKKLTVEKEPKSKNEAKYSNPVKRLETNPSISVRELFPGEEEMNLQCNIEFNNVKGVTPEGWEKCNTTIQYDVETKKLWNELQRPYGNQSSFLRHLVLLEKFFRSGDLVLSHNANPPAANYSDSVQSRLRAYDNIVNDTPRRSEPAISLIEYRKKPSINGKSLLKSNQTDDKNKKFMPPPSGTPKLKNKDKSKKQLPPELIAINTPNAQGRKAIQNVLHNIQQLVKDVTASDPTEVAAAPLPVHAPGTLPVQVPGTLPVQVPGTLPVQVSGTLPVLPVPKDPPKEKKEKSESHKKSKASSKPWRPTLMPLTPETVSKAAREPTQLAVDGRSLPSLVQVMSSGKRFHITLQDYNKMCIMRREKLQQLQDGEKKRPSLDDTTVVTELQPSTIHGNGGTVTQITNDDKADITGSNAATILKNVGLKNITIAPIPNKIGTQPTPISSPSLTSTPIKIPQLGPAVSITTETVLTPRPIMTSAMVMPKIPKSLTVIPQTIVAVPQSAVLTPTVQDGPRP